jgi:hypothetical protein
MKNLLRRPFLSLACVTLCLGALWHSPLGDAFADHSIARAVIAIIGAPFIASMRAANSALGPSNLTPLVGLVLGLSPYLIADWLWRRRRRMTVTGATSAPSDAQRVRSEQLPSENGQR